MSFPQFITLFEAFCVSPNYIDTAIFWAFDTSFPTYVLGWFMGFSTTLVLLIFNWKQVVKFLVNNQYLLAYLLVFSIFGWVGGNAPSRLLHWCFPVVYLLLGKTIEQHKDLISRFIPLVILILSWSISQRVLWNIPYTHTDNLPVSINPTVIFVPFGDQVSLFELYGIGMDRIQFLSLTHYVIVSVILFFYLSFMFHHKKKILSQKNHADESSA